MFCVDCQSLHFAVAHYDSRRQDNASTLYECVDCGAVITLADRYGDPLDIAMLWPTGTRYPS